MMDGSYDGYTAAGWAFQAAQAAAGAAPFRQQQLQAHMDPLFEQHHQQPATLDGSSAYDQAYALPYQAAAPAQVTTLFLATDPNNVYGVAAPSYGTEQGNGPDFDAAWYQGFYGTAEATDYPYAVPEGGSYMDYNTGIAGGGGSGGGGDVYTRGGSRTTLPSFGSTASASGRPASAAPAVAPAANIGAAVTTGAASSGGGGAYAGRIKEASLVSRTAVEKLARSAPLWVVYYNYTVNGPTGQPGILSSEQLVQAYGSRRVQGHTLLVGVAADARTQLQSATSMSNAPKPLVPPSFLRPLVYYLAMAHAGLPYTPISQQQLVTGMPPPAWCLPGSLLQPSAGAAVAAASGSGALSPRGSARHSSSGSGGSRGPISSWDALAVDAAVRSLLAAAPYWCLLNAYAENGRWNCPQNLSAAQVMERLRAGPDCLHACLLGTSERLQGGLWIPTSMVLPLGVLLQALGSDPGLRYTPPSSVDVRYFIEDAVRAVKGRPDAESRLAAHLRTAAAAAPTLLASVSSGPAGRLDPGAAAFVPTRRVIPFSAVCKDEVQLAVDATAPTAAAATAVGGNGPIGAATKQSREQVPVPVGSAADAKGSGDSAADASAATAAAKNEKPPLKFKSLPSTGQEPEVKQEEPRTSATAAASEQQAPVPAPGASSKVAAAEAPRAAVSELPAGVGTASTAAAAAAGPRRAADSRPGPSEAPTTAAAAAPASAVAARPGPPPGFPAVKSEEVQRKQQQQETQQEQKTTQAMQQLHKKEQQQAQTSKKASEAAAPSNAKPAAAKQAPPMAATATPDLATSPPKMTYAQAAAAAAAARAQRSDVGAASSGNGEGAAGPSQTGQQPPLAFGSFPASDAASQPMQQQQAHRRPQVPAAGEGLPAALPIPVPMPVPVPQAASSAGGAGKHPQQQQQQQQQQHDVRLPQQLPQPQPPFAQYQHTSPLPVPQPQPQLPQPQPPAPTPHQPQPQPRPLPQPQPQPLPQPQPQPQPAGGVLVPIPTPFVRFETAVFRLFQGDHGQHAFASLWWYLDPAAAKTPSPASSSRPPRVLGPYSCEQMILAFIAQLLPNDALVCGSQGTLAPPQPPPPAAFLPLGALLAATEEGRPYRLLHVAPELPGGGGGGAVGGGQVTQLGQPPMGMMSLGGQPLQAPQPQVTQQHQALQVPQPQQQMPLFPGRPQAFPLQPQQIQQLQQQHHGQQQQQQVPMLPVLAAAAAAAAAAARSGPGAVGGAGVQPGAPVQQHS